MVALTSVYVLMINRGMAFKGKSSTPITLSRFFCSPDPQYQIDMAKAYNDWITDVFGSHRDKFAPTAVIPVVDIDNAITEVMRVAKMGFRLVSIPIKVQEPYNFPKWEPLWDAIEQEGLALSLHAFSNEADTYPEDWGEAEGIGGALTFMVMRMVDGMEPIALLISSGMLERHPNLEMTIVECGAGWLAWLLYALDEQAAKKHMWIVPKLQMKPSEYFIRQGTCHFWGRPSGPCSIKSRICRMPFVGERLST